MPMLFLLLSFFFFFFLLVPSKAVTRLFELLDDHAHPQRRRNAVNVLTLLLARVGQALPAAFRERIATHLLQRLGDQDLALRVDAAALFGQLDLYSILPELCTKVVGRRKIEPNASLLLSNPWSPQLCDADERVRSAAERCVAVVHFFLSFFLSFFFLFSFSFFFFLSFFPCFSLTCFYVIQGVGGNFATAQ